jgi:hypothetical protein
MTLQSSATLGTVLVATGCLVHAAIASASTSATTPYSLSVFAQSANGVSQPDSIVQWNNSILVGFQNHVAKHGSDGKSSPIVQFSLDGKPQRTFNVPGHNDSLRIVDGHNLWCHQNEDANPNSVVFDLSSGTQNCPHPLRRRLRRYGGSGRPNLYHGFKSIRYNQHFPRARPGYSLGKYVVTEPVLYGNATAIDIPLAPPYP